ncbi:hypothetical protein QVD17_39447 [Tagetes erecta]|uniref:Uncharacterized protein n=1 Tax=Tagetes erecta TaxID=13708 RepID=A0AAD8NA70_TARER|nr:hypothetical protein QVD17_39447 [Tagetes erecta]
MMVDVDYGGGWWRCYLLMPLRTVCLGSYVRSDVRCLPSPPFVFDFHPSMVFVVDYGVDGGISVYLLFDALCLRPIPLPLPPCFSGDGVLLITGADGDDGDYLGVQIYKLETGFECFGGKTDHIILHKKIKRSCA